MTSCPRRAAMERFIEGTANRRECREVVRHLLAGCGRCAARISVAFRPSVEEASYDAALARLKSQPRMFLRRSRCDAP